MTEKAQPPGVTTDVQIQYLLQYYPQYYMHYYQNIVAKELGTVAAQPAADNPEQLSSTFAPPQPQASPVQTQLSARPPALTLPASRPVATRPVIPTIPLARPLLAQPGAVHHAGVRPPMPMHPQGVGPVGAYPGAYRQSVNQQAAPSFQSASAAALHRAKGQDDPTWSSHATPPHQTASPVPQRPINTPPVPPRPNTTGAGSASPQQRGPGDAWGAAGDAAWSGTAWDSAAPGKGKNGPEWGAAEWHSQKGYGKGWGQAAPEWQQSGWQPTGAAWGKGADASGYPPYSYPSAGGHGYGAAENSSGKGYGGNAYQPYSASYPYKGDGEKGSGARDSGYGNAGYGDAWSGDSWGHSAASSSYGSPVEGKPGSDRDASNYGTGWGRSDDWSWSSSAPQSWDERGESWQADSSYGAGSDSYAHGSNRDYQVFVSGLSFQATEDEIRKKFTEIGRVTSVRIMKDKETGTSKGWGFVEMSSVAEVEQAIQRLDGSDFHGRKLQLGRGKGRSATSS